MKQLKMIRYSGPLTPRALPEGWKYAFYRGTKEEIDDWIAICKCGLFGPEINEESFEKYLYSAGAPSPELMIRPGGEQRLSNFLLWQCAYSEFYYTDVLWPDFSKDELHKAIIAFQKRNRRFGGLS